jgi:hypothetical protein
MRRRTFIAGVVSTTATWPLAGRAQQAGKAPSNPLKWGAISERDLVGFGIKPAASIAQFVKRLPPEVGQQLYSPLDRRRRRIRWRFACL